MKMIKTEKDEFLERLHAYLDLEEISYIALARRARIPEATMKQYFSGRGMPTLKNIRKIVEGSGVSADYWVGVTKEMRKAEL